MTDSNCVYECLCIWVTVGACSSWKSKQCCLMLFMYIAILTALNQYNSIPCVYVSIVYKYSNYFGACFNWLFNWSLESIEMKQDLKYLNSYVYVLQNNKYSCRITLAVHWISHTLMEYFGIHSILCMWLVQRELLSCIHNRIATFVTHTCGVWAQAMDKSNDSWPLILWVKGPVWTIIMKCYNTLSTYIDVNGKYLQLVNQQRIEFWITGMYKSINFVKSTIFHLRCQAAVGLCGSNVQFESINLW